MLGMARRVLAVVTGVSKALLAVETILAPATGISAAVDMTVAGVEAIFAAAQVIAAGAEIALGGVAEGSAGVEIVSAGVATIVAGVKVVIIVASPSNRSKNRSNQYTASARGPEGAIANDAVSSVKTKWKR